MLKTALVAMTILGCDCDQKTCEYVRTADLSLASVAECQARMRGEIERTGADYPLLVAICESLPHPLAMATASIEPATTSNPAEQVGQPTERKIAVWIRDGYSGVVDTTRHGIVMMLDTAAMPVGWIERQIVAVGGRSW
jgi:hypothetical protein